MIALAMGAATAGPTAVGVRGQTQEAPGAAVAPVATEVEGKVPPDTVTSEGVLLRLDDVEMGKVIDLYSRITGKILIPSPDLKGKVSIINRERLKPAEAARLIESALELQGWMMIPQGKVIKLVKSRDAVKRLLPTVEPRSEQLLQNLNRMQTFLVPVRYVKGEDVRTLISPLLSNEATIQFNERTNLLIITEVGTNMARLLELIHKVDRPLSAEEDTFESVQLRHVDPKKMMDDITAYARTTTLKFLPNERLQMLVVNGKRQDVQKARQLITLLDRPVDAAQNVNLIIKIKYAKADEIADLVQKLYKNRAEAPPPTFSVNSDKPSNTVILTGPPQLRAEIAELVNQIDTRYKQVLLKVLIGEVNNMPTRQLGVQWEYLKEATNVAQNFTGVLGSAQDLDARRRATIGLRYSVLHPTAYSHFINALETSDNFNVLASPQITVASNKTATFKVADQVPIQTANRISDNSNVQVQSNDFKEAGLMLKVQPSITPDDEVSLDLDFTFSEVGARDPVFQNPTFATRETKTTVLVKDDHTLILAGLMRRDHTRAESRTPFFGRLPLLGPLFRLRNDTNLKQEIVVLLTPTVLNTNTEADLITDAYIHRTGHVGAHSSFARSFDESLHFKHLSCEPKAEARHIQDVIRHETGCEECATGNPGASPRTPRDSGRRPEAAGGPFGPLAAATDASDKIADLLARRRAGRAAFAASPQAAVTTARRAAAPAPPPPQSAPRTGGATVGSWIKQWFGSRSRKGPAPGVTVGRAAAAPGRP
jgi:general secretion pathway protein D